MCLFFILIVAGMNQDAGGWLLIMKDAITVMLGTINSLARHIYFLPKRLLTWRGGGWGESLVGDTCGCHFLLAGDFIYTLPNIWPPCFDSLGIHEALYPEDIIMEIHVVFMHFLFMIGCSWAIFLRRFGGY
jgi:hypothetical protein